MPNALRFADSAKSANSGALRGAPAIGSPAAGITRQNSFAWLDALEGYAENVGEVINAVKGEAEPKPAAAVQKPTAVGGLNPTILYIGAGIVLLIVAAKFFKK